MPSQLTALTAPAAPALPESDRQNTVVSTELGRSLLRSDVASRLYQSSEPADTAQFLYLTPCVPPSSYSPSASGALTSAQVRPAGA